MLRNGFIALFITSIIGAAFAAQPPPEQADTAKKPPSVAEALSVLHAVSQWSSELSRLADENAKSNQVKDYAREMASANADKDVRLMSVAKKHGIEITALDPKTEEGKSVLDRMKAETALLRTLEGDAFDKEYMTLVTNTQQSIIHFIDKQKAAAKDDDVKQLFNDLQSTVQKRVKKAQDVMAQVYGDSV
jgi:predicted outer membrane protein